MKIIGKGAFSTVYRKSTDKVLIKSTDHVKECMSLGWFPTSRLFPKITQVGQDDVSDCKFYESKYYPKFSSLKKELNSLDWEFYNILRGLERSYFGKGSNLSHWQKQFDTIPSKFKHKKLALLESLDALSNYGDDVCFEISPRNVAINNGRLILLDCFFFSSQLNRNKRWN